MLPKTKILIIRYITYVMLAGMLMWQGILAFREYSLSHIKKDVLELVTVRIDGNITRPGKYRVPRGTTTFEILKVAGIKNTSDISPFNLFGQLDSNVNISVNKLDRPVIDKGAMRLEFFFGTVGIISSLGRDRNVQEGMAIDEGDRILTDDNSQAEISLNTFSSIDMDNFSEITLDKMDIDENGKQITQFFQKNGLVWYRITYTEKNEQVSVLSPLADVIVGGRGANYTVDVKYSKTSIDCMDGLILIQRPDGSDAINVISGQSITIFNDGRPFQITKLSGETNTTQQFNQLAKTKADLIMKHMPLNLLYFNSPTVIYMISIQFEANKIHIISIPPQTSVSFFVQGFTTMQESLLYGGAILTSTLIERILNTRIPKYIVFDKDDLLQTASALGGISVNIDEKAASAMKLKSGKHSLKGQNLFDYLTPSISGVEDSRVRQMTIMANLIKEMKSKNIILTAILADQILTNLETNITPDETMKHYDNFLSRGKWKIITHTLPIRETKKDGKIIHEPLLDKCRALLFEE